MTLDDAEPARGRDDQAVLAELISDPASWTRLSGVLHAMDRDAVRRAVPMLAASPCYEVVFPELRRILTDGMPRAFAPRMLWGEGWDWGSVGAHTYGAPVIGPYPGAKLRIGRYCSLAEEVSFFLGNHATDCASMFPFQSSVQWPSRQAEPPVAEFVPSDITVGHDVWIGYGATVLAGTHIGDGAVIGAGALVRGVVPAYAIYAGNPGKVRRSRFPPDVVVRLQALAWWDWPDHEVDRFSALLLDPDVTRFLDRAERERPNDRP